MTIQPPYISMDHMPSGELAFRGRLNSRGQWYSVRIDPPTGMTYNAPNGTGFLLGCRVSTEHPKFNAFVVALDRTDFRLDDAQITNGINHWLPRASVMASIEILLDRQALLDGGLLIVRPNENLDDLQQQNMTTFRKRCRYDVLNAIYGHIAKSNAPVSKDLLTTNTYTRIYEKEDIYYAVEHWKNNGYPELELLNRAFWLKVDPNHDETIAKELSTYSWDEDTTMATRPTPPIDPNSLEYDVFVCHASEDKPTVVRPLVASLQDQGLKVWVDFQELGLGDRLRQRIENGLAKSRFGIVIISPNFFKKPWAQTELDGLMALEMADGRDRILPIWHNVSTPDVTARSPILAARLAARWESGIADVMDQIVRRIRR